MGTLRERLEGLIAKWRKCEFPAPYSAYQMKICADQLAAALVAEGQGAPATNRITLDECFGDPFIWCEGMDHSEALQGNDWILIKAPALRALAAAPSLHKEPPQEGGIFLTATEAARVLPREYIHRPDKAKHFACWCRECLESYGKQLRAAAALHKEGAGGDELCECGQPENSIRHSFTAASSVDAHAFKPSKLRYCGRCNQRRYFVDGKCEMCAASPAGRAEQERKP